MGSLFKKKVKLFILNQHGSVLRVFMVARRLISRPQEIEKCISIFSPSSLSRHKQQLLKRAIRRDMYRHLITPDEYFLYGFAEKSEAEKNEFVGDMERTILCSRMYNSNPAGLIFMDKMDTYRYFAHFFKREVIEVASNHDFGCYEEFVMRHEEYMLKPSAASRGEGIRKIKTPKSKAEIETSFREIILLGKSVIEEVIDQGEAMARLHPESVNTIRLATYCDGSDLKILACFVKIGRGESVVDNGGAGGLLAAVDENTGVITTPGRTEFGEVVSIHPDTGIVIEGYQIPDWNKLLELVDQLVRVLPEQKYVGWDLAYSASKGWLLVEGNSGGQFVGPQISMHKGIRPLIQGTFGQL